MSCRVRGKRTHPVDIRNVTEAQISKPRVSGGVVGSAADKKSRLNAWNSIYSSGDRCPFRQAESQLRSNCQRSMDSIGFVLLIFMISTIINISIIVHETIQPHSR